MEKLPLGVKLAYGAPSFAGAAMAIPIAVHMTKFYADTVLVPLGYLGIAIAVARAFDAITDPLMGWISDRTRTRFGRRRPWMVLGAPTCAIAFWLLFNPPSGLGPQEGMTWFLATYLLYYLFHTIYLIPHTALGPELTLDYHERSSLFAWREGLMIGGTLCAAVLPGVLAEQMGSEQEGFRVFSTLFAGLLVVSYAVLVWRVRERPEFAERPVNPLVPGVRRSLENGPFRVLLGVAVLSGIPGALAGTLLPFFNAYVLRPENPGTMLSLYLALYFGSAFVALPGWMVVSRRAGKHITQRAAFGVGVIATMGFAAAGEGDLVYFGVVIAFAGSAFGAMSFLTLSMKADVIDYDEFHTGLRREAQYTSFWAIIPKFVQIPSTAIPIALLGSIGYAPNQAQSPEVVMAIRLLFSVLPATALAAGLWVLFRYPIGARQHEAIRQGVEAHARGESALDPLTGAMVSPPSVVEDMDTAWFLDHFSATELRRGLERGPERVVRGVRLLALAWAGVLAVAVGGAAALLSDPGSEPGAAAVTAIVLAGVALAVLVFHLARLGAARRLAEGFVGPEAIRAHLRRVQALGKSPTIPGTDPA